MDAGRIRIILERSSAPRRAAALGALGIYLAGLAAALGRPAFVAVAAVAIGLGAFGTGLVLGRRTFDLGAVAATVRTATAGRRRFGRSLFDRVAAATRVGGSAARPAVSRAQLRAAALARALRTVVRDRATTPKPVAQLHADWRLRQALQLNRTGAAARREGRAAQALAAHRRALAIYREAGDRRREAFTLGNLALAEAQFDGEAAVSSCETALSILRDLEDARAEGQVLANLGALHHRAGRDDAAYRCWGEALELLDPSSPEHARISERLTLAG